MEYTNGTIEVSPSLREVIKQLGEPETALALKNLAKNAEILDALLVGVSGFLQRGEEFADNIGESLREFVPPSNGNGHGPKLSEEMPQLLSNLPILARTGNKLSALAESAELDQLLTRENVKMLGQLADLVNKPETLDALKQVAELAPTLAFLAASLDAFLRRGEEFADNIGESLREFAPKFDSEKCAPLMQAAAHLPVMLPALVENLPALAANLPLFMKQMPGLMRTGMQFSELAESEGVQAFLNSGMLTPELVNFLGEAGATVVATKERFEENPTPVSAWGLYRATKDDDVQRGLGFLIEVARGFGQMLKR